jgi:hypothetical protein
MVRYKQDGGTKEMIQSFVWQASCVEITPERETELGGQHYNRTDEKWNIKYEPDLNGSGNFLHR